MGLFKRHAETKQEIHALRTELYLLHTRLEETEEEKRRIAAYLEQLGSAQERITTQVGTVEQQVGSIAGSIAPAINSAVAQVASASDVALIQVELAQMSGLASHVEQLRETVAAHHLAVASNGSATTEQQAALQARLDELAAVLARQQEQIADVALVATDAAERTDTALDEVRAAAQADAAPERDSAAEVRTQLGQLAEKVGAIDSRVNEVSLELTNQLTELSGDLDRASARADALDVIEQLTSQLDDVTGGQQRLASEQARYAIQFREDLAELADRLRRPGAV